MEPRVHLTSPVVEVGRIDRNLNVLLIH
jgi:hypothetical protein